MVQLDAELRSDLEANYVLVRRGKLYSLVGGALAVLAAFGVASYSGAMAAVESSAAEDATVKIQEFLEKATQDSKAIDSILASVRNGYLRVAAGHEKPDLDDTLAIQPSKSKERAHRGEVPFDRVFSEPPKIVVALRAFDLLDNTPRVRIETTPRVDGFAYTVETWNTSTINSLSFDWVAVGVP